MTFETIPSWFTDDEIKQTQAIMNIDFVYVGFVEKFETFKDYEGYSFVTFKNWHIDFCRIACGVDLVYRDVLFCYFEDTSEDILLNKIKEAKQTLEKVIKSQQKFNQLSLFK